MSDYITAAAIETATATAEEQGTEQEGQRQTLDARDYNVSRHRILNLDVP